MATPTIEQFSEEFLLDHVDAENKPSQQIAVREILKNWVIPHLGSKRLDKLIPRDLLKFRSAMRREGLAPRTVNLRLKTVGKMLSFAKELGYVEFVHKMPLLPVDVDDAEFLNEADLDRVLAVRCEQPWRSMVRVALYTGLRIGELRGLQWESVDMSGKTLRVVQATWSHRTQLVTPKSRKPRTVALNSLALCALADLPVLGDFVFATGPSILGYTACNKAIHKIYDLAGLGARGYGWHTLRHTFASHMAMRGVSLRTLQVLLGHANINTTMRYAHLSPDAGHAAVEVLVKKSG